METGVPGMVSARDVDSRSGAQAVARRWRPIATSLATSLEIRRPAPGAARRVHRADRRSAAAGVHYEVFLRDPEW